MRVVKNRQFSDAAFEEILDQLREYTGEETRIDVEFVDEIPLIRTGKRSPIVSTVGFDFQSVSRRRSGS